MAWPPVPAMLSRGEIFDHLVLESADRLRPRLAQRLDDIDLAVEEVPPHDPAPWEDRVAPLGRAYPRAEGRRHRIVLYRRPIELQASDDAELADIVHDVLVEQIAALLGIPAEEIDPD